MKWLWFLAEKIDPQGAKVHVICEECRKRVQLNKPILGRHHIRLTDKAIAAKKVTIRRKVSRSDTRRNKKTPPKRGLCNGSRLKQLSVCAAPRIP